MNKTIIVVQARVASERLPGKAIAQIEGRPSLDHLLERLERSEFVSVVATTNRKEDHDIRNISIERGIPCFTLPDGDCSDSVSKRLLSCAHAFFDEGNLPYALNYEKIVRNIVRVTGDDILIETDLIPDLVEAHINSGAQFTHMPDCPRGFDSEVISLRALEQLCLDLPDEELIGNYLGDPRWFTVCQHSPPHRFRRPDINLEINTREDLERLKVVFAALYSPFSTPFGLKEVLDREDEIKDVLSPETERIAT